MQVSGNWSCFTACTLPFVNVNSDLGEWNVNLKSKKAWPAYRVPMLYFNAVRCNSTPCPYTDVSDQRYVICQLQQTPLTDLVPLVL